MIPGRIRRGPCGLPVQSHVSFPIQHDVSAHCIHTVYAESAHATIESLERVAEEATWKILHIAMFSRTKYPRESSDSIAAREKDYLWFAEHEYGIPMDDRYVFSTATPLPDKVVGANSCFFLGDGGPDTADFYVRDRHTVIVQNVWAHARVLFPFAPDSKVQKPIEVYTDMPVDSGKITCLLDALAAEFSKQATERR